MSAGRVVGLDLGQRRIGVAATDSARRLATPYSTIERRGDDEADRAAVVSVVEELGATHLVVGLPLSLDGSRRAPAQAALAEVESLRSLLGSRGVTVEAFDERLTTVTATRSLAEAGRRGHAARRVVDRSAAAVMLQAWLDGQGSS